MSPAVRPCYSALETLSPCSAEDSQMFDDDSINFRVVANHQEQYSIWPSFKDIPAGWIAVGPEGNREECLDYIEKVWTDMRPKVLRDKMRSEGEESPEVSDDVADAAKKVIETNSDAVKEYEGGKPELYGWFVAKVLEVKADASPDVARAALDAALPPHNIPEDYA